jgi:hypothetical protein
MTVQAIDPRAQLVEAYRLRDLALKQETAAVKLALHSTGGNVRQSADLLGLPHRTLDRLIRTGRLAALKKDTRRTLGRPGKSGKTQKRKSSKTQKRK